MNEEYRVPLTQEQKAAYFERIGLKYDPQAKPTRELLDTVIKAQLRHIPFDDADVWAKGACPSLEVNDLFHKIIEQKRGGYCFELNGLFCRLLKDLGFNAYLVIIHLGGRPDFGAPAHCGCVIIIDGVKYFADVGYGGDVPDGSVEFGGKVDKGFRQYMDGVYHIVGMQNEDGTTAMNFRFKDMPCDPVEFIPLNYHTSQRPGSSFQANLSLNIRRDDGYTLVRNQDMKIKRGDTVTERVISSQEEVKQIAEEFFGIPAENIPTREF